MTGRRHHRRLHDHLHIGAQQIVKVDLDGHQLTLVRDGETVRRIPVSGGTSGGDKRSWRGTAVLMAKEGTQQREPAGARSSERPGSAPPGRP
ncbi:hypothetical protein STSP_11900 [Streptomyces jeddahensis]|uniref:L,D-TPase catalytic domain-containing protein n=1 Tax=Streptomyces jeddahensis TaxID=1716141 RepID=A0A177HXV5_9ACTN|nr:hypothetical protein STSP_11900 [Streptomyces jeddahensis]